MLMRVRKRRTSFVTGEFMDTYLVEFCNQSTGVPDRSLSVFEVEDGHQVTRTHAEFSASLMKDPPKLFAGHDFSVEAAYEVQSTAGIMQFKFTQDTHREMLFSSDEEHLEFARAVFKEHERRLREVPEGNIRMYAKERLSASDAEWLSLCNSKPSWNKWINKQPKATVQTPPPLTNPDQASLADAAPRVQGAGADTT